VLLEADQASSVGAMSANRNHGQHRIFGRFFLISFAVASRKRYNSLVDDEGAVLVGNMPLAAQVEPQLPCPVPCIPSIVPVFRAFLSLTVLLGQF
jgi:hypothetical protein